MYAVSSISVGHGSGSRENPDAFRNQVLISLSAGLREQLAPCFDRVVLSPRQVLAERNQEISHAYFIESGVAALSVTSQSTGSIEVMTLGRRDVAGVSLALGVRQSPYKCAMRIPGVALRIRADHLIEVMGRNEELRKALLRYVQALMIQSSHLVACNSKHELKRRLARWLLDASDKLCSADIPATQAALAHALGVRRAGVTDVVTKLEQAGLLLHRRGNVSIVDRQGMERMSCGCQRSMKSTRERCM